MKDLNLTLQANVQNLVNKKVADEIVTKSYELKTGVMELHLKEGNNDQLGLIEFTSKNDEERSIICCTAYVGTATDSCCLESVVSCIFAVIAQTLSANKVSINDLIICHEFSLSNAQNLTANIRRIGIGTTAESINAMMIQALVNAKVKDALLINVFSCIEEPETLGVDSLSMDVADKKKDKKKKNKKKNKKK